MEINDELIHLMDAEKIVCDRMEYYKWMNAIPYLNFPYNWFVKAIPPFAGAIIRYWIITPECSHVSVYLDCYNRLGVSNEPYWEVYGSGNGETHRCDMQDTEKLMELIANAR